MYYVHRYLRLTITYALIMGVIIAIVPHVYYGPGWSALNIEVGGQCARHDEKGVYRRQSIQNSFKGQASTASHDLWDYKNVS